jgi:hypothetical protein
MAGFEVTTEDPPFVPSDDPLLENVEMFWVGHGLNLTNGGWREIFAWAERIVKSECGKVNYEFSMMDSNSPKAGFAPNRRQMFADPLDISAQALLTAFCTLGICEKPGECNKRIVEGRSSFSARYVRTGTNTVLHPCKCRYRGNRTKEGVLLPYPTPLV